MKLQQLNEYEQQLDEVSRSGIFKVVGSVFGLFGTAMSYAALGGAAVAGALPLAIVLGSLYGAYMGGISTIFVKGKQRTLYDNMLSLVKKRDDLVGKIKGSKEEASESQLQKIQKLTAKIQKNANELDKLVDFGKGGAGIFRRELSPKEKEQLQNVIKAGKGESKDLLSFKYNIDPKKIK